MIDGHLLAYSRASGSWNMAVDQAIAESADSRPTLRFYGWSEPTLSLGYFQRLEDRCEHDSQVLDVVRRSTGGGAIVHHHELTYSLTVPASLHMRVFGSSSTSGASLGMYEWVHRSVIEVLRESGVAADLCGVDGTFAKGAEPFLCFQRRSEWDVLVGGYKVLGSAQRRFRGTILQHGSILIRVSSFAPELPGLVDLTSRAMEPELLSERLVTSVGNRLGVNWVDSELTGDQVYRAGDIEEQRFAEAGWLNRR